MIQYEKDFTIAYTIFGREGIVIDIKVDKVGVFFMDCNYWSCFTHEDERLFIGGLQPLQMTTIRYIPQNENYIQYVKVMTMLRCMFSGNVLFGSEPTSDDIDCVEGLIEMEVKTLNNIKIPKYIKTLWHHFLMKQTQILLNLDVWRIHSFGYNSAYEMDEYGFLKFKKLFMKNEMFNFLLYITLLPNLQTFTVGDVGVGQADPSIPLTLEFTNEILSCISYLNVSVSSLSFRSFQIIKPKSPIDEYIFQTKDKYLKQGWILKKDKFVEEKSFGIYGVEMLVIERMKH